MTTKTRFYELDLFRFLAAMSVVLFHYTFRGFAADNLSILSFPSMGNVFKYGYLGVDLFFIISGFVILMTAINTTVAGFAISRITRLYPAFWASVTLTALVTCLIGGDRYSIELGQYLLNLTMVSGYFGIKPVDGVYWTLLIELKFYFLIMILLVFNGLSRIQLFLSAWLIVSLLSGFVNISGYGRFLFFPDYASYFIAGATFFMIRKEGFSVPRILLLVGSYVLSMKYAYLHMSVQEKSWHTEFSPYIVLGLVTLFYIVFALVAADKTRFLNSKRLLSVGLLTYPLYLIHQNIGFMIFNYFGSEANKYLMLGVGVIFVLSASYAINRLIERRFSYPMKKFLEAVTSSAVRQAERSDGV